MARGATLALGVDCDDDALAVATGLAAEREARIVGVRPRCARAADARAGLLPAAQLGPRAARGAGPSGSIGITLEEELVAAAAASTAIPGRLQVVGRDPLTVFDGAHNADATAALVSPCPSCWAAIRSAS